jgi:xanthine dehydrogenase accessory factor
MIHWKETAELLARLDELARAGRRAALATVVRIEGSAYRRPGAKLLVEEGGGALGSVSGGCLEADVREVAQGVLATGKPTLRHYNTGGDEDIVWGLGLGCNGRVEILVQPATDGPLAALAGRWRELLAGDAPFAVLTTVAAEEELGAVRLVAPGEPVPALPPTGRAGVYELAGRAVFVEPFMPPPHLLVCGADDDAIPLVAYAADAGFRVTVADHRPALLEPGRFPRATVLLPARAEEPDVALPPAARTLAVVKTHSLAHDRAWVGRLLAAGLPYVGVLGPRERTRAILRDLGADGDERVFGPVGLDLGADGPWQVATSIVAELLAFGARREPRHLSLRDEAIHAREDDRARPG